MRILQLSKKFPFPLNDGASIAVTYLAKALSALGNEVTLLSMNTSKHWYDLNALPADFDHYDAIHTVYVDNHIRPVPAFLNLFSSDSYHVTRFDNTDFAAKLEQLLREQEYDVVQLESMYLTPYIPIIRKHSRALIALRAHNVEHEIWERVAQNSRFFKKWYLGKITPRLKSYETRHLNDYDLVVGISERDVQLFRQLGLQKPAVTVPIGLDSVDYHPDMGSFNRPLSLSFIGSLDWMPNQEGLQWFLESVWQPHLAPAFPQLTFEIAGRTAPAWIRNLNMDRVRFVGEVPNAADFINKHSVMVVPLLSGGGMRAKILEGMAVGKVVLSTTLGMEGIHAEPGKECLLADAPEEFVQAVRWCYEQGPALAGMGYAAQSFYMDHYDHLKVAGRLVETYRSMCHARPLVVTK